MLEELDEMDWSRLMRAMEAERIGRVEEINAAYIRGMLKERDISAEDWDAIREHGELVNGL